MRPGVYRDIAAALPATPVELCKMLYGGMCGESEKNALYANISNMRKRGYVIHRRRVWRAESDDRGEWEYYIVIEREDSDA